MVWGEVEVAQAGGGLFVEELRLGPQADGGHQPGVWAVGIGAQPQKGRDALTLARYWHETGVVTELRRRSGLPGPVGCRTVRFEFGATCEELSLGGLTVRTGHTAILTSLEHRNGITVPFDELLSRALAEPDVNHEVWWETTYALQQRLDPAVWDAAAALHDRPVPLERYFAAEVLRTISLFDESDESPFDGLLVDLFLPWVAREPDPRVTWSLTAGLADAQDPRAQGPLPELTRHFDSMVRQWAVGGLHRAVEAESPQALEAVAGRTGDADAAVRRAACTAPASAPPHTAGVSDVLAACLDDPDETARVAAAARLAMRDDPRGDEVLGGLDATDEGSPYYWLLYDVSRYRELRDADTQRRHATPGH